MNTLKDERIDKMRTVHIMVGIPGSGKTTLAIERFGLYGDSRYLSSDVIREELETNDNAEVFQRMNHELMFELKSGNSRDIYYDATNVSRRRRRGLYINIKAWSRDTEINIIFVSVPLKTAIENNKNRSGKAKVPEDVILRMHRQLQVPRIGVDCDRFEVVGLPIFEDSFYGKSENIESVGDIMNYVTGEWKSEISLTDTEHDCPPWHLEDVFTHINMAIKNSEGTTMKTISLFHDLGKGVCKVKGETGYATYRNHADVGAHYFLNYITLTRSLYIDPERDLDVLETIHQHMNFHNKLGRKNVMNNRLNDAVIMMGHRFAEIDGISKITKSKEK